MTRAQTAVIGGAIGVGAIAIYVLPVVRLVVLSACMGLEGLTVLMFVEGMVALARALSPVRASAWIPASAAEQAGVVTRVVAIEVSIAVAAAAVLATSAPWWQPVMAVAPPLWVISLLALRGAGTWSLTTLGGLRRPIALLGALVDIALVLPIVALLGGSLAAVVVTSTIVTWLLVAAAWRSRPMNLTAKQKVELEAPRGRWQLGTWIRNIASALRGPLFVAIAGLAVVVPFSATVIIASLLAIPFVAGAVIKPSQNIVFRVMRCVILGGLAFLVIGELGPTIYRAVFPASFGDGRWLELLAWGGFATIPAGFSTRDVENRELRRGIAGAITITLMLVVGITAGTAGFLVAIAASSVISAFVIATRDSGEPTFGN